MKKFLIALVAVVAVVVIGVLIYLHVQKDKPVDISQVDLDNVDLSTLAPADPSSLQPIRLLNSEDIVYIEGISTEDAAYIDQVFRLYEETDGAEVTEGELAWIYNQLQPTVANWFNPEFDLVDAFNASDHTEETVGSMSWLFNPIVQNLAKENSDEVFYYRYDGDLNGYRMSTAYFFLGFAYSGMWQVAPQQ